ncbi:MAG: Gfo/Idh/MocA family oxidoreductase [Tabrizicola sp.]|uniref:Gfo/Idh/MocA family protein n=1 Tax=Tabrizicola sp. TaxID=2005166 RepID=UPI0027351109|nr:Gfo/Idh/MocA family oxidoreductase [Tabrizicola sp.]MDP3264361.1 Gfo/Idh/MocA family oxidoreductase [Tabrizicola sp.]MDP3648829.1 Gfo/Idh/MocA family oxidoreductase [Paracoccaceae bacterium]MDZ4065730.1 Gfo/Idh/MocA family oxidoreductase [Tabrizicola sp.]
MTKIALVGIGKIAVDQHVPAITASPEWELAATVSRHGTVPGTPAFTDIDSMLAERPDISVVSLALPPVPRFAYAEAALRAGRHVMLEKPPGATLAEIHALQAIAAEMGVSLYATWHSRMARAVAPAKAWLAGQTITRANITWREDVRKWHPGQDWVFEPGGMGVFDPGINALSILTEILPALVHVTAATLTYPANRQTPIAAALVFSGNVSADFDWRQEGPQTWDIEVETHKGHLALRMGGNVLEIDHKPVTGEPSIMGEYPALYARMADLVRTRASDVDLAPMIHVADAMTLGRRMVTDAFEF